MDREIQSLMARHCGAVLMGIKPAALFTIRHDLDNLDFFANSIKKYNLEVELMKSKDSYILVLVYDPILIQQALGNEIAFKNLADIGYPVKAGIGEVILFLKRRFHGEEFPHEVGFFLGYPPVDVLGFMRFGGKNCKHSCLWKVYGDVEKAKMLCSAYQVCKQICCRHIQNGGSLLALQQQGYRAV